MTTSKSSEGARHLEVATFGAGCFWCVEARVRTTGRGSNPVESGYMGGEVENPRPYREVCGGRPTGHAEVVRIHFDPPGTIDYGTLLAWFWRSPRSHHGSTARARINRHPVPVGDFSPTTKLRRRRRKLRGGGSKKDFERSDRDRKSPRPSTFYAAEDYHQDYFREKSGRTLLPDGDPPQTPKARA